MPAAGEDPVTLAGDGLLLRPFLDADLPALQQMFADPVTSRWNPGPDGPDALAAWARARNDWRSGDHASWAIATGEGALAGQLSLHHIEPEQRNAEVGYVVAPWARGRHLAVRALEVALGWAFGELGLLRVHLFHAVENTASCRVAARAGFALEGMLRQSFTYADGRRHDEHLHARLGSDPRPPAP